MFSTGNPTCDNLNNLHIQGNIVPRAWFKTITKKDLKNPKPHLLAISILSDIVYWYRPTEVRNELTGELEGLRKKFRGNLLQRSYKSIADMYGCSKDTAKEAIVFLESLGVIRRVFEDISVCDVLVNNVMYLDLNVDKLRELTYPMEISTEGAEVFHGAVSNIRSLPSHETPHTNTENIQTEISSRTTVSINPSVQNPGRNDLNEFEIVDEVEFELSSHLAIPPSYQHNKPRMLAAVRILSDWFNLQREHFQSDLAFHSFRLFVDCLAEMACETSPRTYNKSIVPSGKNVIDKINECLTLDGSLYTFTSETIEDYITGATSSPIKNVQAYMKSVIWTSFFSYKVKLESSFAARS